MRLEEYHTLFVVGCLVLILATAFPGLSVVFSFPKGGETFTELWVLGPGHMAEDYPFNVEAGEEYAVYVGVGNHMGASRFYNMRVKLRTQSEPLPNATAGTPSPLPTLYEEMVFVEDGGTWETPLNFSFAGVLFFENRCQVESVRLNGVTFDVDKTVLWDEENQGFYSHLFIELWIYQVESDIFVFHNRFVGLWLNMTGE